MVGTGGADGVAGGVPQGGFDPAAAGCDIFVVRGDVYEPEYSRHFSSRIEAWNAMRSELCFHVLLEGLDGEVGEIGQYPVGCRQVLTVGLGTG